MKFLFQKKVVATFLLLAVALGGYYASSEYMLEEYELLVKSQRDSYRDPEVSQSLVVVGMDLKTYRASNGRGWSRKDHSKAVNFLGEAGVDRIFFDFWFKEKADAEADREFAETLFNSKAKLYVPVRFVPDDKGGFEKIASEEMFTKNAQEVSINVWYNGAGQVVEIPYRFEGAGSNLKTMATEISGRDGEPFEMFPVDYAFDWKKIPTYSAVDILEGKVDAKKLAGKTVIYGFYAKEFGDVYIEPGGQHMPGMAIQAISANLLMKGKPVIVDKSVPIGIALLTSLWLVWACGPRKSVALSLAAIPATFVLSIYLDSKFIVVENLPVFAIFVVGVAYHRAAIYIDKLNESRRVDHETGIPNKEAFIEDITRPHLQTIICMNMDNYNIVRRSLSAEQLQRLVEVIKKRLSPLTDDIYQGPDGSIYFAVGTKNEKDIMDSLGALKVFFLNPINLDAHMLNLRPAFGFDMEFECPLKGRLSQALVASAHAQQTAGKITRYQTSFLEQEKMTISMQDNISQAITKNELEIYVQPQMCLKKGWTCSAEALIRWNDPVRGLIGPSEFMATIEKSPLIHAFTIHVIQLVINALPKILSISPDFKLSINVPPILMTNPQFLDEAFKLIDSSTIPNTAFVLEITERGVLIDKEIAKATMSRFVNAGIQLSIDDFGTENANIEILRSVPASELKIDRSFVKDICKSPQDKALVESVINMAHRMDYSVVAEGVEDKETLDLLTFLKCDKAQGYYLSKPLKLNDFTGSLTREHIHRNIQNGLPIVNNL